MRSLYLATVATVIIFVMVFSIINMSGEALFARANTNSLDSLPSHFRWGYQGYVTVDQWYYARNQVGNLSGIARAELRSEDVASTNTPGLRIVDVFAAPDGSMVYTGLNRVSGVSTPGPGQVIVLRNSQNSSLLSIGQVIHANFTFYAGSIGGSNKYVSITRNLTVAGFADSTLNGFGYLTNSETEATSGDLFPLPTLVANWDDLIPPVINFVNSNKAEPFITELFVYVKPSGFASFDVGAQVGKAQSLQGQIQSITKSMGGTTDSWLIDQLEQGQSQSSFLTVIALVIGTVMIISTFSIIDTFTRSTETFGSADSETDASKSKASINSAFEPGFYWNMLGASSIGVVAGIIASILIVSILVFSSSTFWIPSLQTLAYSCFYGAALAAVVWFQSRDLINRINNQASFVRNDVHKLD